MYSLTGYFIRESCAPAHLWKSCKYISRLISQDFDLASLLVPDWLVWAFQFIIQGCSFTIDFWISQYQNHPVSSCSAGQNPCLSEKWEEKATVTLITTLYNSGEQIIWSVETYSRWLYNNRRVLWVPPLLARIRGYIGQLKIREALPALIILYFCCNMLMMGLEITINSKNPWTKTGLC